jgi:hypothetical protein
MMLKLGAGAIVTETASVAAPAGPEHCNVNVFDAPIPRTTSTPRRGRAPVHAPLAVQLDAPRVVQLKMASLPIAVTSTSVWRSTLTGPCAIRSMLTEATAPPLSPTQDNAYEFVG